MLPSETFEMSKHLLTSVEKPRRSFEEIVSVFQQTVKHRQKCVCVCVCVIIRVFRDSSFCTEFNFAYMTTKFCRNFPPHEISVRSVIVCKIKAFENMWLKKTFGLK